MKFKIHFTVNGCDDYIIIKGETIEEIRESAKREVESRGLDEELNNFWSEKIE